MSSVLILDAATRAAILLASIGTNGTREAGIVTALAATFGAGRVTRREYSAAGKLLRTQINEAVTTDTASRPKTVSLGSLVTTVTHASGTTTRIVVSSSLGTRVAEVSPAVGSSSGLTFRALTTFDTPTGSLSTEVTGEGDIPVGAAAGSVAPTRQDSDPVRGLTVVVSVQMAIDDAGTLQTQYFCTGSGWVTSATDTPASTYIDGRVTDAGNYSRSMFAGRALFGAQQIGFGAVTLANQDGALDAWRGYGFDSRQCEVWVGVEGAAFPSEFTLAFVTEMSSVNVSTDAVALALRDPMRALDKPLLRNRFAGTGGLEGPSSLADQPRPRCLGTTFHTPMVLVNAVSLIYFVCDEATTPSASSVFDGGVALTLGSEYTTLADLQATAPSAGQARIYSSGPTYVRFGTSPSFEPTISRLGTYGGAAGATLAAECGLTVHGTYTSSPVFGEYVDSNTTTYLAAMTSAYRQTPYFFGIDRDGLFITRSVDDPVSGTATVTINQHDVLSLARTTPSGVEVPVYRVVVRGNRNWSKSTQVAGAAAQSARQPYISSSVAEALATLTKHPTAGELVFEIGADPAGAAAAHLALHGEPRDWFVVVLPMLAEWVSIDLGTVVELEHPRMGLSAGRKFVAAGIDARFAGQITLNLWG